ALADRVATWPEAFGHAVAHHHNARRVARVTRLDASAAYDARAVRREIIRAHRVDLEPAEAPHRVDSRDVEADAPEALEWNRRRPRGVRDAGNCRRGGEQPLLELLGVRAVQLHAPHVELDERYGIDVVPEVLRL